MEKLKISVIAAAVFVLLCGAIQGEVEGLSSRRQAILKLVDAAWQEYPKNVEATVYKTIWKPGKTRSEIQNDVEKLMKKLHGLDPNSPVTDTVVKKEIEYNVEMRIKHQASPIRIKEHIIISGDRELFEVVQARSEEEKLDSNTPYERVYVNSGGEGDNKWFSYDHKLKLVRILSNKPSEKDFLELAGLPLGTRLMLRNMLGKKEEGQSGTTVVVDSEKVDRLVEDKLEGMRLAVQPDVSECNVPCDEIRIFGPGRENKASLVLICDEADFSHVYDIEACNPISGVVMFSRKCSGFSESFCSEATLAWYNKSGKPERTEEYRLTKVDLNPSIPDGTFSLHVPSGYAVVGRQEEE